MKLFSGVIAFLFAFLISGVAAFFSVTGLATLFAATFWPVVIMGASLEGGKLVAAGWLHANWKNPKANFLHKGYLTLAVLALMIITAIGIYGYLSKGYLEQQAPLGTVDVQVAQIQQMISQDQTNLVNLGKEQSQLDSAVNSLINQNLVMQSQRVRKGQKDERADIQHSMDAANADIEKLNNQLVPLKMQENDVGTKLGPIKYVAALFGWKDTDTAVRMVILILMFAFDPLAVTLILSGTISISDWLEERREKRVETLYVQDHLPLVQDDFYTQDAPQQPITPPAPPSEPQESATEPLPEKATDVPLLSDEAPVALSEPFIETDFIQPEPLLAEQERHTEIPMQSLEAELSEDMNQPVSDASEKSQLLSILERRPELVQELIDAVMEWKAKNSNPEVEEKSIPEVEVDTIQPSKENVVMSPPKKGWLDY